MKQPSVDLYQNIIWEQRATNYRGTVRVKLETLKFGIEGSRQLDVQNVRRLQHIFQDQGCYRLDPENRIPAVIDQQALENAMRSSDTTLAALLQIPQTSPPFLKFPAGFRLQCLKGQSRAKAAEMVLRPEERWWGIDLYLEGSFRDPAPCSKADSFKNPVRNSDEPLVRSSRIRQMSVMVRSI